MRSGCDRTKDLEVRHWLPLARGPFVCQGTALSIIQSVGALPPEQCHAGAHRNAGPESVGRGV